jgi:hypothetical protein
MNFLCCALAPVCVPSARHNFCIRRFQMDHVIYDVMLNQTVRDCHSRPCASRRQLMFFLQDIANNNNKYVLQPCNALSLPTHGRYYMIQLLQDDENSELFYVFKRWGRVGYAGAAARQDLKQYDCREQGTLHLTPRPFSCILMRHLQP